MAAEWQLIEMAPKDGTPVLVYDEGAICIASFSEDDEAWIEVCVLDPGPTHWMPLPDPPDGMTTMVNSSGANDD